MSFVASICLGITNITVRFSYKTVVFIGWWETLMFDVTVPYQTSIFTGWWKTCWRLFMRLLLFIRSEIKIFSQF
jgi:hypothetical protein